MISNGDEDGEEKEAEGVVVAVNAWLGIKVNYYLVNRSNAPVFVLGASLLCSSVFLLQQVEVVTNEERETENENNCCHFSELYFLLSFR